MFARATILAGDPNSPVILHVPVGPPTLSAAAGLPAGTPSAVDLIVAAARRHATVRPHAIINRSPRNDADAPAPDANRNHTHLCDRHALAPSEFFEAVDPYVQLVSDIVNERLSATGSAVLVDIRIVDDGQLTISANSAAEDVFGQHPCVQRIAVSVPESDSADDAGEGIAALINSTASSIQLTPISEAYSEIPQVAHRTLW
ncbi:MAG: hypothetical protein WBG47_13390 [Gordonia sp. (in: high G+C Gram-positive bacteria)]|uniref:hypothetical protein n=1 Tax=Gordonia sp. (in: high G+C Gram-positive bacteria) TaxID=84139 RepID=UPI003C74E69F